MKGLVITTDNKTQFKDYTTPLLDSIGKEVGGYIEVVHPRYLPSGFCMVVNEEGLLQNLPFNYIASVLYGTQEYGQPIVGNAVILREGILTNGERDFVDMTSADRVTLWACLLPFGAAVSDILFDPPESEAK